MQDEKINSGSGSGSLVRLHRGVTGPRLWAGGPGLEGLLLRGAQPHCCPEASVSSLARGRLTRRLPPSERAGGGGGRRGGQGGGGSHDVVHEPPLDRARHFCHVPLATHRPRGRQDAAIAGDHAGSWPRGGRAPFRRHGGDQSPSYTRSPPCRDCLFGPLTAGCLLPMASREMGGLFSTTRLGRKIIRVRSSGF